MGHKDLLGHLVHQEEAMMVSLDHQDLLAHQAHPYQELPEAHRVSSSTKPKIFNTKYRLHLTWAHMTVLNDSY